MPEDHGIVCKPETACKARAQDSGSRPSAVTVGSATPSVPGLREQQLPFRAGSACTQGDRPASPAPPAASGPRAGPGQATRRPHAPSGDPATPRRQSAQARAPTPRRASARNLRAPAMGGGRGRAWPAGARGGGHRADPGACPPCRPPPGPHGPGTLSERGALHTARRAWSRGAYRSRPRREDAARRRAEARRLAPPPEPGELQPRRRRRAASTLAPPAPAPPPGPPRPSARHGVCAAARRSRGQGERGGARGDARVGPTRG